jgi:hypothetical protein
MSLHLIDMGGSLQIKHCHWTLERRIFEEALADWLSNRTPKNIKSFPIIAAWGYG